MSYLSREYRTFVVFTLITSGLVAGFAPWQAGPFLLDWIAIFAFANMTFAAWVLLRATYLSIVRRK